MVFLYNSALELGLNVYIIRKKVHFNLASPCYLLLSFLLLVFKYKNCSYKSGLGCLFCPHQPGGPMRAGVVTDGLYEAAPGECFSTEDVRWDFSLLQKP